MHSPSWRTLALTDQVEGCLEQLDSDDYQTVPYRWAKESLFRDSLSNPDYLVRFAKRCGYDIVVPVFVDSVQQFNFPAKLEAYDLVSSDYPALKSSVRFFGHTQDVDSQIGLLFKQAGIPECSVSKTQDPRNSTFYKGRYFQYIRDYDSALKIFEHAFAKNPSDLYVRLHLSQILVSRVIQSEESIDAYNPAFIRARDLLESIPDTEEFVFEKNELLARMDVYQERWNSAENHIRTVWQENRPDSELMFLLSRLNVARQKTFGFGGKVTILKRIVTLNPAHQAAWLDLAQTYFYQNQMEKAELAYRDMLRIHPNCQSAWLGLGKLYLVQRRFDAMVVLYDSIIKKWPESSDVIYNLGLAYHYQGDTENAVRFFKRAIEIDDHAYSHYYLGKHYLSENMHTKALMHFRKCVSTHAQKDDPYVVMSRNEIRKLVAEE